MRPCANVSIMRAGARRIGPDDGAINVLDLVDLLLCFGQPVPPCGPADVNHDGAVNVLDLVELLLTFGTACP